jgi:histidine triad (HIT) family protein
MGDCVFCKIINGQIPGVIVDKDESVIVFISLEHHPLIVPKKHYADLLALDDEIAGQILKKAIKIAKAMHLGLPCDGICQTQMNEICADQKGAQ